MATAPCQAVTGAKLVGRPVQASLQVSLACLLPNAMQSVSLQHFSKYCVGSVMSKVHKALLGVDSACPMPDALQWVSLQRLVLKCAALAWARRALCWRGQAAVTVMWRPLRGAAQAVHLGAA